MPENHAYSSTHLLLPADMAESVRALGRCIPASELAADGLEDQIHITTKYGLTTADAEAVQEAVRAFGPVEVTLGDTAVFAGAEHDVLYVAVESADLVRLHAALCRLEHVDTHPSYTAHVTVAYIKPGCGDKYARCSFVRGERAAFYELEFSSKDGKRTTIELGARGEKTKSLGVMVKAGPQDEARDADGKWTAGAGGGASGGKERELQDRDGSASGVSAKKELSASDRDALKNRHAELLPKINELGKKGSLTASEAKQYQDLTGDLHSVMFDLAKPLSIDKVPSEADRKSTLSPAVVVAAQHDLLKNKDAYMAITSAAAGVHFAANTAVDDIVAGKNSKIDAKTFRDTFAASRDALRKQYGDTVPCFRAEGKQGAKQTQNWATTREFAAQFGSNITQKNVPVDDVLAVNVGLRGKYHELIVASQPVQSSSTSTQLNTAHDALTSKLESGRVAKKKSFDAEWMQRLWSELEKAGYNPSQPRNERGQWSGGSGAAASGPDAKERELRSRSASGGSTSKPRTDRASARVPGGQKVTAKPQSSSSPAPKQQQPRSKQLNAAHDMRRERLESARVKLGVQGGQTESHTHAKNFLGVGGAFSRAPNGGVRAEHPTDVPGKHNEVVTKRSSSGFEVIETGSRNGVATKKIHGAGLSSIDAKELAAKIKMSQHEGESLPQKQQQQSAGKGGTEIRHDPAVAAMSPTERVSKAHEILSRLKDSGHADAVAEFANHVSHMSNAEAAQFSKESGLRGKTGETLAKEAHIAAQSRSKWQQECRKEGISVAHFKQYSKMVRDEHNKLIAAYNAKFSDGLIAKVRALHRAGKDLDSVVKFDQMTETFANNNPELFHGMMRDSALSTHAEATGADGHYWSMLVAGKQPYMTKEQAFSKAFIDLKDSKDSGEYKRVSARGPRRGDAAEDGGGRKRAKQLVDSGTPF